MVDIAEGLKKRADEMLKDSERRTSEVVQFATSMLANLYGPQSPQLAQFREGCKTYPGIGGAFLGPDGALREYALGAIKNAKEEIEAGLVTNVRILVVGEVLSELLRLARETLSGATEAGKNVSAVLTAAAYEGTIRRMGEELGSVSGRPDLQDVITALKDRGILKGGEVGTAQSYLKFRNDSLHADWTKVSQLLVESCLGFTEGLLVTHLSG